MIPRVWHLDYLVSPPFQAGDLIQGVFGRLRVVQVVPLAVGVRASFTEAYQ